MTSDSENINGATNKIQWFWVPRVIVFLFSIIFGWVIFWKRVDKTRNPTQKI